MRARRRLLAGAAVLAALPAFAPPLAPAQQPQGGVATDVRIAEVTAAPGEIVGDRVKAINLSGRNLRVGVLIRDVGSGSDGNPISVPRDTGARSAASWVRVQPSQFELAAGATRDIAIRVSVPAGTRPGGYYASILLDAAGVTARRSSEHLVLVRVPGAGAAADARIVRFRVPTLTVGGPVDIKLEVANAGNVHAIVSGSIRIKDQFGNRVGSLSVPNAIVLPGQQRLLTIRWLSPPPLARVRAVANLQLAGKGATRAASGWALAWWVIAAAVLAVLLPMYGLAARRRRRRRKAREAIEAAARPAPPVGPLAPTPEGAWPGGPPEKVRSGLLRRRERGPEPGPVVPQAPGGRRPAPLMVSRPEPPAEPDISAAGAEPTEDPFRKPPETPAAKLPEEKPSDPVAGPAPSAPAAKAPSLRPGPVVVPSVPPRRTDEPLIVHEEPPEEEPPEAPLETGWPRERKRIAEPPAEEPSWAPVEESEEFEEWLEAVRSQPEPEDPLFVQPPKPERPVAVARPAAPERPAPVPERPVPVVRPPIPEWPVPVVTPPAPEPVVPAARAPEPAHPVPVSPAPEEIQTAWPEEHVPAQVPSAWGDETGEALTGAAALRRAKVALDMLGGPTGETGAILDAAIELLRSVRGDPGVVSSVQAAFAKNRGRRKLGPLALALGVVEAPEAPAALLDAYATAPKVVADRLQIALAAYDTAELRRSIALIDALPPARRFSLGL